MNDRPLPTRIGHHRDHATLRLVPTPFQQARARVLARERRVARVTRLHDAVRTSVAVVLCGYALAASVVFSAAYVLYLAGLLSVHLT